MRARLVTGIRRWLTEYTARITRQSSLLAELAPRLTPPQMKTRNSIDCFVHGRYVSLFILSRICFDTPFETNFFCYFLMTAIC